MGPALLKFYACESRVLTDTASQSRVGLLTGSQVMLVLLVKGPQVIPS